jgi:FkbM family methyltransferase
MRDLLLSDIARMTRDEAELAIRARVQSVPVSGGLILSRVMGRFKMLLSAADRGFACNVMLDGYWEMWLTKFLATRLKPGMQTADVGANFGYYTLLMADAVGANGRVAAFEPHPDTAHVLRQNIVLNGMTRQCEVHEVALGAAPRTRVTLFTPDGEPKNALVVDRHYDGGTAIEVAATTMDDIIGEAPLDFIKIDAEGAEEGILTGMSALIARCRPAIVLEFNAGRYPDPAAVLGRILAIYGKVQAIGFDGRAADVSPETVLTTNVGEDWLLFFE